MSIQLGLRRSDLPVSGYACLVILQCAYPSPLIAFTQLENIKLQYFIFEKLIRVQNKWLSVFYINYVI